MLPIIPIFPIFLRLSWSYDSPVLSIVLSFRLHRFLFSDSSDYIPLSAPEKKIANNNEHNAEDHRSTTPASNKVDQDLLFLSKLSPLHTKQARSSKLWALIFG